mgnify:CR=1 FL=1
MAIVLSILLFFQQNWWPHGEVLGRVPGREGWHSDQGGDGLEEHPDMVVFRWEAPLFFANSGIFAEQVRELVQERRPGWVVLQCEAITDIDVTAAGMLERLDNELNAKGVHLAFVELRTRLRDLVHDYGLFKTLDRDLVVKAPEPEHLAHVLQDDLHNTYQGSDGGKAFNYIP